MSDEMSADELQRGQQMAEPEGLVVAASEDAARYLVARQRCAGEHIVPREVLLTVECCRIGGACVRCWSQR